VSRGGRCAHGLRLTCPVVSITASDPPIRSDPWRTIPQVRTVLAVVHNVTAATRLFDILPLLATDPRIHVVFTITESSAFDAGTADHLSDRGVIPIPWDEAMTGRFDLAIAASYGGDLHAIRAPLLTIPHGMGYNKYLTGKRETGNGKRETGNGKPVFGLSPEWLLHDGRVIPSVAVLSHHEQRERLRAVCPEAVPHTLVAGDICYDKLAASMSLRSSYRQAMNVSPRQLLVVVSSTWGPDSLLGRHFSLVRDLAVRLPVDEFRVVVALHPNIWSKHSRWQVREWMSDCARAGVLVTEDVDQWRASVVAADLVVGDHGSVPFYAAALGVPVLMPGSADDAVDSRSPIARLMAAVPGLTIDGDLPGTLRTAVAEHDPQRLSGITRLVSSEPGRAAVILREALYRLLDLPEPNAPADISTLPLPAAATATSSAHLVQVELDDEGAARLCRYPADRLRTDERVPRGWHLVVGGEEPWRRWLDLADVIVGPLGTDPEWWIADTLTRLPGCVLAAAPVSDARWMLGDRTGTVLEVAGGSPVGPLVAPVACHWIARGRALTGLVGTWVVTTGAQRHQVTIRLAARIA
jgi:hypothetical protein